MKQNSKNMKEITKFVDAIKADVVFKIGGNAQENFDLIDAASPEDIWFHVDNLPSEHVIACIPTDKEINRAQLAKIVKQGAVICKQYSKYASTKNLPIIYSKIENIEKQEKIGSVLAPSAKTINI